MGKHTRRVAVALAACVVLGVVGLMVARADVNSDGQAAMQQAGLTASQGTPPSLSATGDMGDALRAFIQNMRNMRYSSCTFTSASGVTIVFAEGLPARATGPWPRSRHGG